MIFPTIDDFQKYYRISKSFEIESITTFEQDAINGYMRKQLGTALTDKINTYIEDENPTADETLDALIPYYKKALANFLVYIASPNWNVTMTEQGIGIVSNNTLSPASKERVEILRSSTLIAAWDAVEEMLLFLLANKDDYSDWTDADEYKYASELFINFAQVLSDCVNVENHRATFLQYRTHIEDAEWKYIIPVISEALADRLKQEMAEGTLETEDKKLVKAIQKSIANYAYAEMNKDPRALTQAETHLSYTTKYVQTNITRYPEYEESDVFVADPMANVHVNKKEDKYFVM